MPDNNFATRASAHVSELIVYARGNEKVFSMLAGVNQLLTVVQELNNLDAGLGPELTAALDQLGALNETLVSIHEVLTARLDVEGRRFSDAAGAA